ncbi:hypothetical protein [Haloglycomyces albus]|uniref:hypothetical protein n=1 Tax=Haloglycomyces albus TaxID=526067 RepID=UPI00046D312C|nr:hypothetical protein [Haloglycomyces albus]
MSDNENDNNAAATASDESHTDSADTETDSSQHPDTTSSTDAATPSETIDDRTAPDDADNDTSDDDTDLHQLMADLHATDDEATSTLQTEVEQLRAELRQVRTERTRDELAHRFGLPSVVADRLQGDTAEAMEADAKRIAEALQPRPTGLGRGGMDPTDSPLPDDPDQLADLLLDAPDTPF